MCAAWQALMQSSPYAVRVARGWGGAGEWKEVAWMREPAEEKFRDGAGGGVQQESVDVRDRSVRCGAACSRLVKRGSYFNEMFNVVFNLTGCVMKGIIF